MPNPGCFDFWIKHCSSSQLWFCKHFTKAPLQSFLKGIHQSPAVFGGHLSMVKLGNEDTEYRQKPSHLHISFRLENVAHLGN